MSSVGSQCGALVMITSVSYKFPKYIFWLQLTITNKVIKFLELEYFRVWNWEPSQVQYIHRVETVILTLCEQIVQKAREVEINILHFYKTASTHAYGNLSELFLSFRYLCLWFGICLLQNSAFLDSTRSAMYRICQCAPSVQPADHLVETLWQFLVLLQQKCLK